MWNTNTNACTRTHAHTYTHRWWYSPIPNTYVCTLLCLLGLKYLYRTQSTSNACLWLHLLVNFGNVCAVYYIRCMTVHLHTILFYSRKMYKFIVDHLNEYVSRPDRSIDRRQTELCALRHICFSTYLTRQAPFAAMSIFYCFNELALLPRFLYEPYQQIGNLLKRTSVRWRKMFSVSAIAHAFSRSHRQLSVRWTHNTPYVSRFAPTSERSELGVYASCNLIHI